MATNTGEAHDYDFDPVINPTFDDEIGFTEEVKTEEETTTSDQLIDVS